ncbi:MAG: alpha/beta fold hydrolase [Planctomycetota bacterium]
MTGSTKRLTVALALCAPVLAQGTERGRLIVTREDIDAILWEIEWHLWEGNLLEAIDERSALARTNDEFDRISGLFLEGRLSEATRDLAALEESLDPLIDRSIESDSGLRADVLIDGRWCETGRVSLGDVESLDVRVRSLWARPDLAGQSLVVAGRWHDLDSCLVFDWDLPVLGEIRLDAGGRVVPTRFEVPVSAERGVTLVPEVGAESVGGAYVVDMGPAASLQARVAGLDRDDGAGRAFFSRASLIANASSMERSAEFLRGVKAHVTDVDDELSALENGDDPYRLRRGETWRTFVQVRRDLAANVYLPSDAPADSIPLVLCLHGAGTDESYFFGFAGFGHVRELADRHGCLVVAPFTPDLLAQPKAFDALLAGIAEDYPIDSSRIFVLGHSLGAIATAQLCRDRPERIAGACCVAGFAPVDEEAPPILVVQGERDPSVSAARIRAAIEASEGAEVTYVELEDQGHTLLLPEALDRAFARWFE